MAPGLAEPGGVALGASGWLPVGVAWVAETLSLLRRESERVTSAEIETSIFAVLIDIINMDYIC